MLSGGLGPTAMARFARDVLQMRGVKWLIIFEGVNDIGGSSNGATTATQLNTAFSSFADMAHAQGIKVYGATITPFNGNSYYSVDHEAARTTVNNFIRTSTKFDAVHRPRHGGARSGRRRRACCRRTAWTACT